jgi:uncharacterized protein
MLWSTLACHIVVYSLFITDFIIHEKAEKMQKEIRHYVKQIDLCTKENDYLLKKYSKENLNNYEKKLFKINKKCIAEYNEKIDKIKFELENL